MYNLQELHACGNCYRLAVQDDCATALSESRVFESSQEQYEDAPSSRHLHADAWFWPDSPASSLCSVQFASARTRRVRVEQACAQAHAVVLTTVAVCD
jgi:hypothetical protein